MIRHITCGFDIVRNGVKVTELSAVSAPTIKMNATAEIKMTLSGTFAINERANFLSDWIRPWIEINGTRKYKGIYSAATVTENCTATGKTISIEAYDKAVILKQNAIEKKLYFSAGTKYTEILKALLKDNDMQTALIEDSNEALQTDREDWEIGTSYLSIINELLGEINYNSIWINDDGVPVLEKKRDVDVDRIDIVYKANEMSLIEDACTKETDAYESYNVFIVTVDNPDYAESMIATAVNDDPTNPLSVVSRGRRIVAPVEKLNNIASMEELQVYVERIKSHSMRTTEICSFATAINPDHTVGDDMAIHHPHMNGLFREQSWEITLDGSDTMTHTAQKVRDM